MRWLWMIVTLGLVWSILALPNPARAADFVVYSVYRSLDMGNPGETPQKDYFVNVGSSQGVREGSVLTVYRRTATYDLLSEKLYREVTFPIAKIKVIHSESNAAIARMDKMFSLDKTPATTPNAIMVGDLVKSASD